MSEHNDDARRRLPNDRESKNHSFTIAGHQVVLTTGEYEDGTLGEIFVKCDSAGSTMRGILEGFATEVSLGLQYGVPLAVMCDKHISTLFEPNGYTGFKPIPFSTSLLDYIFRYLEMKYLPERFALREAA